MTTTDAALAAPRTGQQAPPYSRAIRVVSGVSLALGGVLNGLPQYVVHLMTGDLTFSEQIVWGAQNRLPHGLEQGILVASTLVMLVGLLGVAQVTRWRAPRLTAVATPLVVWGMWGFQNVLAMGFVTGTVAPSVLGVDAAVRLNDSLVEHAGPVTLALVPHLIGSFVGLVLLAVAAWRSGVFPRTASVLLIAFLVWDFALPVAGPLEPHPLLTVAWVWMGVTLVRMSPATWHGRTARA